MIVARNPAHEVLSPDTEGGDARLPPFFCAVWRRKLPAAQLPAEPFHMGAFPLIRRNAMAEHHCNPSEPPPAPRGNVPSARSLHSPLARRAFSQCRRLLRSPPPLQALPVPPVDGGISPQRLPGAAGQSPGRAPPWPPAPPPPSPAARRPHPGGSSGSWAPPAAPAGILPHSATAPQAARPPESVRIIGQIMRYHERRKRVDCKSEGNILGVKKWL